MTWPHLVPDMVCTIPIEVVKTEGLGEDGAPKEVMVFRGKCNYKENAKQILSADRQLITIVGTALMNGDIAPREATIEGFVSVHGKRLRIHRSEKARNPDGTVNYTSLELIG